MDQAETATPTRAGGASRRAPVAAAAAVVLVVVAGALAWLGGRGQSDDAPVVAGTAATRSPSSAGSVTQPPEAPTAPTAGADGATTSSAAPGQAGAAVPVPPLGGIEPVVTSGAAPAQAGELSVAVSGVSSVTTTADGLGEIAGPGVLVEVAVDGPAGAALDAVSVAAFVGQDGLPLRPAVSDDRAEPLPVALGDDGAARGRYLFAAPPQGEPFAVQLLLRRDLAPVVVQALTLP